VSGLGAVGAGVANGLTFGAAPVIGGLAAAAGQPGQQVIDQEAQAAPMMAAGADVMGGAAIAQPFIGAGRMIWNMLSSHPDPTIRQAYNEGRQAVLQSQQAAQQQHPWLYGAGQVAGGLAVPVGGELGAVSSMGRVGKSILSGAIGGGLYGAGDTASEGGGALDIAKSAAGGAVAGGALGGVLGGAIETGSGIAKKVTSVVRGHRDVDAEAGSRVLSNLHADAPQVTKVLADKEAISTGREAGTPIYPVDFGGENTRALLRSAANTSPSARNLINEKVGNRYRQQADRFAGFLGKFSKAAPEKTEPLSVRLAAKMREVAGVHNSAEDMAALKEAARKANAPAYRAAYNAGDKQIWSNELERLTAAPSIQHALRAAVSKWKDWQVADGFGAANPPIMVKNGLIDFGNGKGLSVFPNIQFWDYAARHIADAAEKARRSGASQEAARLGTLEKQLKTELDKLVPQYKTARQGAAKFFNAEDALEAGRSFARPSANIGEAKQALARMSPPERELFARGYASEKADALERNGSISNHGERQKLAMALGTKRATVVQSISDKADMFKVFRNAENASEAGKAFVTAPMENREAIAVMGRMNAEERDQFSSAFASELATQIEKSGYRSDVLNSLFVGSPRAVQRVRIALGPEGAKEFEALVRIEGIVNQARLSLGNSTTARQLHEMGAAGAGAGAVGLLESLKGALNPAYIIAGALVLGGRAAAQRIDNNVALRVAEMLFSDNPSVAAKGYKVIAQDPVLRDALRRASDIGVRQIVNYLRPSGVGAAALMAGEHLMGSDHEMPKNAPQDNNDNYQGQVAPP
jgi:hypothetical protein